MNEIELKFQIPLTEQKRLYQWFLSKNARSVALYAKYYDTQAGLLQQGRYNSSAAGRLYGS